MQKQSEFYNGRYPRFFQIAFIVAFAAACTASFLFDIQETRIKWLSMTDIFFNSRIFLNLSYIVAAIACIWLLYTVALKLNLISTIKPCVVLTEKGIFVKKRFYVPWKAVVAVREYRLSHIEFDEMWVLIEVDSTPLYIDSKTRSEVAAFYKILAKSNDQHLALKNFLPINCQKMGISSAKLLKRIDDYLPK